MNRILYCSVFLLIALNSYAQEELFENGKSKIPEKILDDLWNFYNLDTTDYSVATSHIMEYIK